VIHREVAFVLPAMTTLLAPVLRRGAVVVLVAGLIACRNGDPSRSPAPSAASSSLALTSLPVPPPLPGDDDPAPVAPALVPESLSLPDRLVREASSRPAGAVRGEALVTALATRGVAVARTRQVLGKTMNARYCALAVTGAGVVASVCEFDSPSEAKAAIKASEQRFGKYMPNRRFVTNGKSLLTIANVREAVASEAEIIAATFAALHAT
jgi:hypothetical protein